MSVTPLTCDSSTSTSTSIHSYTCTVRYSIYCTVLTSITDYPLITLIGAIAGTLAHHYHFDREDHCAAANEP